MYPPVTTAEQISVDNLERYVEENYSEKSQKLYLAVLKQVRTHGGGYLTPSEIDGKYIAGFRTHLSDRLSPGSISQYLRSLRSLLNSYLGPEYRSAIKEAFAGIGSKNENDTRHITPADFCKLKDTTALSTYPALEKVRRIFILSTLLGGIDIEELPAALSAIETNGRATLRTGVSISVPPQALSVIRHFREEFGVSISQCLSTLADGSYPKCLDAIGATLSLRHPLLPKSSADVWVALARTAGVPATVIASAVNNSDVAILRYSEADESISADDIQEVYYAVADTIESSTNHWYGARCFTTAPTEIKERLLLAKAKLGIEPGDVYIPFSGDSAGTEGCDKVMQPMLFFRATATRARDIKRHLGSHAYVYSYRTGEKSPAIISDTEMMTFMLLARVGADTLKLYFPKAGDNPPGLEINDTVIITDGNFSGHVGIIEKAGSDSFRVIVRITGISAVVTAEVPKKFLRGVGDNA
ncbi:phage integrase SAM-like domain-containing protein [Muribaculum intestinale]|uniref:phage integrase SAM-like domain-containing protein n=1 Tax=Muribaculum intestinale TaxID=1796646 RepID=UPI002431EC1B|nr:phage integrase SAM-like domain-containing protein [Muribaculum intestinale]